MARPDRVFRTDAIILRRQDLGEADRLLTLFTPNHGKLAVVAKGVRKPTARNSGHVELFALSTLLIARGRGDLDIVTQAEMSDPFLPLRESLECAAYASYVIELIDRFTEQDEQNTPLYHLLADTLGWLAAPDRDLRLVARYYEMHLLRLVGFHPQLFTCTVGLEPIEAQAQFFSVQEGGLICPEHAEGNPRAMPITLSAVKVLRHLQRYDFPDVQTLRLGDLLHSELEHITQQYIVYLLERRLKSVEFIRRLRRQAD